jgi:hypothetical protein
MQTLSFGLSGWSKRLSPRLQSELQAEGDSWYLTAMAAMKQRTFSPFTLPNEPTHFTYLRTSHILCNLWMLAAFHLSSRHTVLV